MPDVAVTYSIPESGALARVLASEYELGNPVACKLWKSGVNTTYAVEASERYMLRVYRAGRRTPDEVRYELDLLCHLDRKRVPVARPIPTRDGRLFLELPTPEGMRPAVLFAHAGGSEGQTDEVLSCELGRAAAQVHRSAADFRSCGKRRPIDLELLPSGAGRRRGALRL